PDGQLQVVDADSLEPLWQAQTNIDTGRSNEQAEVIWLPDAVVSARLDVLDFPPGQLWAQYTDYTFIHAFDPDSGEALWQWPAAAGADDEPLSAVLVSGQGG